MAVTSLAAAPPSPFVAAPACCRPETTHQASGSLQNKCEDSMRAAIIADMARGEVPVELGAVAASQGSNYRGSSRRAASTFALALIAVAAVCFVSLSKSSSSDAL